jgi:nitrate/TMAO reductase-like tetraheme cytochrome c subunit
MSQFQKLSVTVATALLLTTSVTLADERYNPIKDDVVAKECGACHMAFQPQMLPKRSWVKIMMELPDHFGEDASLDAAVSQQVEAYLVKNAADSGWWGGKFMRGVKDDMTLLRITETPHWVHEHNEEVPARAWKDPKVKSKANCLACHPRANSGDYDDD